MCEGLGISYEVFKYRAISGQLVTTRLHFCSAPYGVRCESFLASVGTSEHAAADVVDTRVSENITVVKVVFKTKLKPFVGSLYNPIYPVPH